MQFGRMGAGFGRMGVQGASFNFASFMAAQSAGLYYDFTKTDRHFQENVGPTLADDVGEAIGLALDQRLWGASTLAQVLAGQSELVTNGGFDADADWTKGTGWTIAAGKASQDGTGTAGNGLLDQTQTIVNFGTYRVQYTVSDVASGGVRLLLYGNGYVAIGVTRTANGTYVEYLNVNTGSASAVNTVRLQPFSVPFVGGVDNVSVKLIPGIPAIQASGTLKPTLQTTGAKFDGSDDNLLTSYLAGSGANFIVALVTVPATLGGVQAVVGAAAASNGRVFLSFDTDGKVAGGIGTQNNSTIVGAVDRRGTEVVVGISFDGSTVRLFDDLTLPYEAAQSGAVTTSIPFRLGANNGNGTAGALFGGSIKKLVAGREFLTLSRYQQIRNALLAA